MLLNSIQFNSISINFFVSQCNDIFFKMAWSIVVTVFIYEIGGCLSTFSDVYLLFVFLLFFIFTITVIVFVLDIHADMWVTVLK